jgi:hypothetical protein
VLARRTDLESGSAAVLIGLVLGSCLIFVRRLSRQNPETDRFGARGFRSTNPSIESSVRQQLLMGPVPQYLRQEPMNDDMRRALQA